MDRAAPVRGRSTPAWPSTTGHPAASWRFHNGRGQLRPALQHEAGDERRAASVQFGPSARLNDARHGDRPAQPPEPSRLLCAGRRRRPVALDEAVCPRPSRRRRNARAAASRPPWPPAASRRSRAGSTATRAPSTAAARGRSGSRATGWTARRSRPLSVNEDLFHFGSSARPRRTRRCDAAQILKQVAARTAAWRCQKAPRVAHPSRHRVGACASVTSPPMSRLHPPDGPCRRTTTTPRCSTKDARSPRRPSRDDRERRAARPAAACAALRRQASAARASSTGRASRSATV